MWIRVKLGNGMAGERLLNARTVAEVRLKSQKEITFIDEDGMSFEWVTTGTMAEYAKLVTILELDQVA